ncbi:MAG: hypothetical protein HOO67_03880 [Candidatus Peribacteraceae bacterium]|nr:hypothetical protein [Candidatus Peribacteraceae bacterium]
MSFSDYGISSDEPMGLWFGYHTYGYLFLGLPVPQQPDWTFYGPAWQLMLAIANEVMGSLTGERLWLTRHFLNFGLFFAGTVVFYRIGKRCLKSEKFALLATVFLMLSPRIFAHSFHNPKDMPAMIFFLFAIASMFWFLERRSLIVMLLHTVLCAVLISMRMFGLIVPLLTLSFVILERNRRAIRDAAIYGLLLCVMIITVWPVLWSVNPLVRFSEALGDTAGRPGGGLYFGELVTGNPWHYIPVWIFITTPILYSCAFAIGCGAVIRDVIARPLQALHAKTDLTLLAWFFVPLAALIILRIGIFDEWRHVLFLYPAFLLIGMRGIEWLFGWMGARRMVIGSRALAGVITVSLLWTGYWMFTRHPYEYMYFSVPSRFVEGKFEMDYWSLGSRDALQWILNHDRTPVVKVYPSGRIARIAADTLPLNGWARIEWSDPDKADYIIDNFRGNNYVPTMPTDREIHIIKIDGLPIVGIYKGPDTQGIYKPHLWLEDQVPMP